MFREICNFQIGCLHSVCTRAAVEQVELLMAAETDLLHIFGRKTHQNFNSPERKQTVSTPTVSQKCGRGGPSEDNDPCPLHHTLF